MVRMIEELALNAALRALHGHELKVWLRLANSGLALAAAGAGPDPAPRQPIAQAQTFVLGEDVYALQGED